MESVVQYKPNWKKYVGITSAVAGITAFAGSAFATETAADLMAQVNIAGVHTAAYTFMGGLVLLGTVFFGRKILARLGVSL
jgi:hypothetical protein